MIIFGTRGSRRPEVLTEHTCSACDKEHSIFAVPFQRYFHIFWIPVFPIGTETVIVCSECGATFVPEKYPLSIDVRNQIKTPKWTFAGLFLIGLLIAIVSITGFIETKQKKGDTASRVESPEKGDIYEIKLGEKDYSIMKITAVTPDSVFFLLHMYGVERESQLKNLLVKYENSYDDEYIASYAKQNLLEMVDNKTICNILRD